VYVGEENVQITEYLSTQNDYMRRLLPLLFVAILSSFTNSITVAQSVEQCAAHLIHNNLLATDPAYAARIQANEAHIQSWIQNQNQNNNNGLQLSTNGVLKVPVVVHVVHSGQAVGVGANISQAQIQSGLDMMNDRFRKTPGTHGDALGVDTEIEFCLAVRDPNCLATSGIVRVNGSTVTNYSTQGITAGQGSGADETDVKDLSRWPNTDYMNIWVVTEIENNNGNFGIQGYAYFPGASAAVDGIVIMHTAFGNIGTVNSFNNLGRTLTHEAGHYFNLYHTFEGDVNGTTCPPTGNNCGSGQGDCCGDTERHIRSGSNCPAGQMNSCINDTFGLVIRNYLDYSSQTCANMFSLDQKNRMRAALCTERASLLSSLGCTPISISPPTAATCSPQTTNLSNGFGMGIRNVTFETIDVSSSSSVPENGYVDRSCGQATDLDPSTLYPISIETGSANNEDVRAYIDYNNDGDFTDPGEQIFSSDDATTHTGNVTTPASPTMGSYLRMRVISDFQSNNISGPCYTPEFGQIEDFAVIFNIPTSTLSLATAVTNVTCNGGATGSIDLTPTGGTTPYIYLWSNGAVSQDLTNVPAGTYTVTVTDNSSATAVTSATVGEPTVIVIALTTTGETCAGNNDGVILAGVSGGVPPYTFLWSNAGTTASINNLTPGSYTVTVTDANGCTNSTSGAVSAAIGLNLSSVITNVTNSGGSDGAIDLTVAGGTMPYTYLWTTAANTEDINFLIAGTYTVTVTDLNGCTGTGSYVVTQPGSPLALSTNQTAVSCNGGSNGAVDLTVSGGVTPYSFVWSNAATTEDLTGIGAGTYTVTVTDGIGGTATTTATITEPTIITNSFLITDVTCNGLADGSATASASGGSGAFTYVWSNGQFTAAVTGLAAGTYTVTVSDANLCTASFVATVNQPTPISVLVTSGGSVSCSGGNDGTATASASGGNAPYFFLWSNGQATASATGLTPGTHTVTVTDNNGCNSTGSASISEPAPLLITTTVTNVSCNGLIDGTATATGTGGTGPYTFLWSDGQTTATAVGLAVGSYFIVMTDANGCVAADSGITVTEPAPITAIILVEGPTVICNGGSVSLGVSTSPGYSYQWRLDGIPIAGATDSIYAGTLPGTYTVEVSLGAGCSLISGGISVAVSQLTAGFTGLAATSCVNELPSTLTGSPLGGQFTGAGTAGTSFDPSIAGPGLHNITYLVTDTLGCSDSVTQSIDVVPTPMAQIINGPPAAQPFITYFYSVGATSGSAYTWTISGGNIVNNSSNVATVEWTSGVSIGQISVKETNLYGCADSSTLEVVINPPTGLDEAQELSAIRLYPNPVRGVLSVDGLLERDATPTVRILSASGRLVYQESLSLGAGKFIHQIDVSQMASGIYFFQMVFDNHTMHSRVIVQH